MTTLDDITTALADLCKPDEPQDGDCHIHAPLVGELLGRAGLPARRAGVRLDEPGQQGAAVHAPDNDYVGRDAIGLARSLTRTRGTREGWSLADMGVLSGLPGLWRGGGESLLGSPQWSARADQDEPVLRPDSVRWRRPVGHR